MKYDFRDYDKEKLQRFKEVRERNFPKKPKRHFCEDCRHHKEGGYFNCTKGSEPDYASGGTRNNRSCYEYNEDGLCPDFELSLFWIFCLGVAIVGLLMLAYFIDLYLGFIK